MSNRKQLSPSDFLIRIRDIAKLAGVQEAPTDQCWVSADLRCPYGQPHGQYILRPELFCKSSCDRFPTKEILSGADYEAYADKAFVEYFDIHSVTVASELHARADELVDKAEAGVLELAADLIREKQFNRKILLEEDLPGKK